MTTTTLGKLGIDGNSQNLVQGVTKTYIAIGEILKALSLRLGGNKDTHFDCLHSTLYWRSSISQ